MGFCRRSQPLCRFDPQYQGVIDSLLGRVAVAEGLDDAVAIAKRFHYRFRIVTLDGPGGQRRRFLTGGSLSPKFRAVEQEWEIEKYEKRSGRIQEKLKKRPRRNITSASRGFKNGGGFVGAQGELSSAAQEGTDSPRGGNRKTAIQRESLAAGHYGFAE